MNDTMTDIIEIDPPATHGRRATPSKWVARLAEARSRKGRWMMVTQPMSRNSAAQLASDLRCSHRRSGARARIRAVQVGDKWEATFGPHPLKPVEGEFHVWVRWVGVDLETAW